MATMPKMVALFDCTADDVGEISFKEGDILVDVVKSAEEGWYEGRVERTSERGLFPYNYVEILTEPPASKPIPSCTLSDSMKSTNSPAASPPNSTISSTWSVVSANHTASNEADNDATRTLDTNKPISRTNASLDPFDAIVAQMQSPVKGSKLADKQPPSLSVNPKPKVSVASKPISAVKKDQETISSTFERPMLKSVALQQPNANMRSRSLSASVGAAGKDKPGAAQNLEARNALENALSRNFSPASPRSLPDMNKNAVVLKKTGLNLTDTKPTEHEEDGEEIDGFQIVKPSQLLQRKKSSSTMMTPKVSISSPFLQPNRSTSTTLKPTLNSSQGGSRPADSDIKTKTSSKLEQLSSNPAPRLPSRPRASRSNRTSKPTSRSTTTDSMSSTSPKPMPSSASTTLGGKLSSSPPSTDNLARSPPPPPPAVKPKPSQLLQPALPQRPKPRSSSNPMPVQPKPAELVGKAFPSKPLSIATTNGTSSSSPSPEVKVIRPVTYKSTFHQEPSGIKPSMAGPVALPGLASSQRLPLKLAPATPTRPIVEKWHAAAKSDDANLKPSALLNRARSATTSAPSSSPSIPTKPVDLIASTAPDTKLNLSTLPARSPSAPAETVTIKPQMNGKAITDSAKPSLPGPKPIVSVKSKSSTAPRPPPSLPPKTTKPAAAVSTQTRYEILFEAIHDEGYVDGETVRILWRRSKLPDAVLADVWRQCDPEQRGLLDKQAFMEGMTKIDGLLQKTH
ncbi:uncharacterized protein BYT42DRAFT_618724 [Radiomyces spectabilis]|uniref:uncharacterized protein n=1 Tax=Radiomyces spectabilis TaxID=64574 RepID=UPI00221F1DB0|nr:uncharacterized protein BYT42DRAFT_618724 [Radiomyces spectabilis]KAI8365347.1 hypothetical protein BYT42DRAFT_618724 [Radiomyces spectabilis]